MCFEWNIESGNSFSRESTEEICFSAKLAKTLFLIIGYVIREVWAVVQLIWSGIGIFV